MNTQQLKYVLTLAETKSFSSAAEKLFVTQPSLSQYIAKIERQLGTTLFDRSTKPISLTENGKKYVETARQILTLEKELIQQISEYENLETGSLCIGTSAYQSSYLLPQSIVEYHKRFPGIDISLYEDTTDNLFHLLQAGSVDLVIASTDSLPLDFDVEILSEEHFYLAVPESFSINKDFSDYCLCALDIRTKNERYLFSRIPPLTAFRNQPFILTDNGKYEHEPFQKVIQELQITQRNSISVHTINTAFSYTVAGAGISLIPDSLICFGNFQNHPCYYPLDDMLSKTNICMFMRRQNTLPKIIKSYGQVLKDLISVGTWRI